VVTLENTQAIRALRERLREIEFTPERVHERLGTETDLMRSRGDQALQVRRLSDGSALAAVLKLFFVGVVVPEDEVARALAPVSLDDLAELGILERTAGGVHARIHLSPVDGLALASDRADALDDPQANPDHVGGANPTSRTLANLTVRLPVDSALDLGTGSGIQALLVAPHARRVVATDVNPRALRYTEFNALLNGISNIEPREGSFFDPVEGDQFDLIVCNPPFVISPDARFSFRDSGLRGDEVCREVVRGAARSLHGGGYATILCNWACRPGERWQDVPAGWLDGSGCDAWVLDQGSEDPLKYAALWNQFLRVSDRQVYPATLDRWVEHHRELGIETVHYGAVILRRSPGANWRRFDDLPGAAIQPASEHILRVFAAHDYLATAAGEDALFDERLAVVHEHRLDQTLRLRDGEYRIEGALLRLETGVGFEGRVDAYTLHMLGRLDGERPVRDIVSEVAVVGGIDPAELARLALPVVRRLFELGFLVRVE
jgi:hypothetical protein